MPRRKPEPDRDFHLMRLEDEIHMLDTRMKVLARSEKYFPEGWHRVHDRAPCTRTKKRMTIRLDADVFDWYSALGRGYQGRVNEVLRCYMDAVIAKYIEPSSKLDKIGPED